MKQMTKQQIDTINNLLVEHGGPLTAFYDEGIRIGRSRVLAMVPAVAVGGVLLGVCLSELLKKKKGS